MENEDKMRKVWFGFWHNAVFLREGCSVSLVFNEVIQLGVDLRKSRTFCSRQGQLRSDLIAQGFVQSALETLQGRRMHNLTGHIPLLGCPQGEKVILHIQSEPLVQFAVSHPPDVHCSEELTNFLIVTGRLPLGPPKPSPLQAKYSVF